MIVWLESVGNEAWTSCQRSLSHTSAANAGSRTVQSFDQSVLWDSV